MRALLAKGGTDGDTELERGMRVAEGQLTNISLLSQFYQFLVYVICLYFFSLLSVTSTLVAFSSSICILLLCSYTPALNHSVRCEIHWLERDPFAIVVDLSRCNLQPRPHRPRVESYGERITITKAQECPLLVSIKINYMIFLYLLFIYL